MRGTVTTWSNHHRALLIKSRGRRIVHSPKNDIAALVKTFLTTIIVSLDLEDDVKLHSKISTFNVGLDLWAVRNHGIPVGVIEVKTPDISGGASAMKHPNALDEISFIL